MTISKKIGLIVVLAAVAGIIWYLEGMKVHPGAADGSSSAPQDISVLSLQDQASSTSGLDANATSATNIASSGQTVVPGASAPAAALTAIAQADVKAGYHPAIEIANPAGFINTSPFKLSDYIGKKVILLDFWTYSCINCIRTLPYLTAWDAKYKDQGLLIVGVHTPEFDFEKDINNVKAATQKYGINYPVVLDSNYGTWSAYGNLYWPHEYLIDIAGYIVHDHVGEGSYDETESIIQKLLQERTLALKTGTSVSSGQVSVTPANLDGIGSPETYFGSNRNNLLANGTPLTDGTQTLSDPASTAMNSLYLSGTWNFIGEYATNATAGAKVFYEYNSAKVFFVASAPSPVTVEVFQDGAPITAANAGSDVVNGKVTISGSRLYNLVNNAAGQGVHTLELIIDSPGLQAFTFTFG